MRGRPGHNHDVKFDGEVEACGTSICTRWLHSTAFTHQEAVGAGGARYSVRPSVSGTLLRWGSPRVGCTSLRCHQRIRGTGWSCMDSPHAQLRSRWHGHIRRNSCFAEGHNGILFATSLPRISAYFTADRYGLRCGGLRDFCRLIWLSGSHPTDGTDSNR